MYELKKPFTDTEKFYFLSKYNYTYGLKIDEGTDTYNEGDLTFKGDFLFALEKNEIMGIVEGEIDVPEYETKVDDEGNEYQVPIMIEVEETIVVPIYDPETGEQTGEEEQIIKKLVPQTHKETVELYKPIIDPDYDDKQAAKREAEFNAGFFNTSLGYIRRSVTMANGTQKDFLSDLLPAISASVSMGQAVNLIAYDKPPFDEDVEDWTEYQHIVQATPQFIQECFLTLSNDFLPINEDNEEE